MPQSRHLLKRAKDLFNEFYATTPAEVAPARTLEEVLGEFEKTRNPAEAPAQRAQAVGLR